MEAQPPLVGWRWAELQPVAPASQLLAAAELRVCLCVCMCAGMERVTLRILLVPVLVLLLLDPTG